jgi:hypothetical protein
MLRPPIRSATGQALYHKCGYNTTNSGQLAAINSLGAAREGALYQAYRAMVPSAKT